jgi:hypothetical protein
VQGRAAERSRRGPRFYADVVRCRRRGALLLLLPFGLVLLLLVVLLVLVVVLVVLFVVRQVRHAPEERAHGGSGV